MGIFEEVSQENLREIIKQALAKIRGNIDSNAKQAMRNFPAERFEIQRELDSELEAFDLMCDKLAGGDFAYAEDALKTTGSELIAHSFFCGDPNCAARDIGLLALKCAYGASVLGRMHEEKKAGTN